MLDVENLLKAKDTKREREIEKKSVRERDN